MAQSSEFSTCDITSSPNRASVTSSLIWYLLFVCFAWLWLGLPILRWIKVMTVGISILPLMSQEKLSVFPHWKYNVGMWAYHVWFLHAEVYSFYNQSVESFINKWMFEVKWSHVRLFATLWTVAYQAPLWNDWCETISWCGFHLHFPDNQWCWAPFHVPIDHLYIFSGKMSVWFLFPFSIKLLFLIKERVMGVLYMFWLLSFYLQYDLQIFSPIP